MQTGSVGFRMSPGSDFPFIHKPGDMACSIHMYIYIYLSIYLSKISKTLPHTQSRMLRTRWASAKTGPSKPNGPTEVLSLRVHVPI